ncbi:hypothetical protein C1I98_19655 [Spongiactinospora gelatinilytica]|uniref:Uncharacterized protein n=1 Tax=Spongiactinospora gelatinilytica TaxID=2666298 RepID=A0A2W2GZI5_9ACTN|nr:hypothetical protein [Spongiactinospora gelatinilytica]PZG42578.1 hypothetical protein C1I98_19655 [Spongiactinospora gelatinilytica]
MSSWSPVDWIQYEWDEHRGVVGPVRTSLSDTRGWDHKLVPWLDPGSRPGVSVCRLVVDGRVVVLARSRAGADSRRGLRVVAYLGGDAVRMPWPTMREALALAPLWVGEPPPTDHEPVDLAELTGHFAEYGEALEVRAREGAGTLAPIVFTALRHPGMRLAVVSQGDPAAQMWALADILRSALGVAPETFSTYESEDFRPGPEIVFLPAWPGPSSRAPRRLRVDLREPVGDHADGELAECLVAAYSAGTLEGLTVRAGMTEDMPWGERLALLRAALSTPVPALAGPAHPSDHPEPPEAGPRASPEPAEAPDPDDRAEEPGVIPEPAPQHAEAQRPPASAAVHDMVAEYEAWMRDATTREQERLILIEFREWMLDRAPELRHPLSTYAGYHALRSLLRSGEPQPPVRREPERSPWLDPRWLALAGLSALILLFQLAVLLR